MTGLTSSLRTELYHESQLISVFCSRSENHHQRASPFVQTARGSHDVNHFLFDGVRIIRLASLQGGTTQQVRSKNGRSQRLLRNLVQVCCIELIEVRLFCMT